MRIQSLFVSLIGLALGVVLLGGCGGSGGGGGGGEPSNQWDEMKWDEGEWGAIPELPGSVSIA